MPKHAMVIAAALMANACSRNQAPSTPPSNQVVADAPRDATAVPLKAVNIRQREGESDQLLYDGRPLRPAIEGNNGLEIVKTFQHPDRKLYVVMDMGGTACPAQFYVVEVIATGARATKAFGTCSDTFSVAEVPGGLTIKMPGALGSTESEAPQAAAAGVVHFFTFRAGRVTETKGSPVLIRITPAWLVGYWVSAPSPAGDLECGTDSGVRFEADGTYHDGGHRGRFRTDGRSITYYDRAVVDAGGEEPDPPQHDGAETTRVRADGADAFIENGERLQRCAE